MSDRSDSKSEALGRVTEGTARVAGSELGARAAAHLAALTDRAFSEATQFERFAKVNPDRLQGRALEFLSVLDFNQSAQKAGSRLLARSVSGTGPWDLEIFDPLDGRVLERIQAKSYQGASQAIRAFAPEKYRGMTLLSPSDQTDEIRTTLDSRSAQYLEAGRQDHVKKNITGQLEHGVVQGKGVTSAQARKAAGKPNLIAAQRAGAVALKEVGSAAAAGAVSAGLTSLLFHSATAALDHDDGRSHAEIVSDVVSGTAAAAAKGGIVAGGARAIAIAARNGGATSLANSTAPTAMANTVFEAGHATYRYLIGDIERDEYREEAGGAVLRGTATFYCGMAGQVLIPVPLAGALVGATVGYITSAVLVESGILGVGPSNIVAIEARRRAEIEQSCRIACARLGAYERAVEETIASDEALRNSAILPALATFQGAVVDEEFDGAIAGLGSLNLALGHTLPFRSLEEFDQFMLDEGETLRL